MKVYDRTSVLYKKLDKVRNTNRAKKMSSTGARINKKSKAIETVKDTNLFLILKMFISFYMFWFRNE